MFNIMEHLPKIMGFFNDPKEGVIELEKVLVPLWRKLEEGAGSEISFVLNKSNDTGHVTVSLWTSPGEGVLNFYRAYSLPQLVDEFKNLKKTFDLNGISETNTPEPSTAAIGTDTPATEIGTSTTEATGTDTGTITG